MSKVLSKKQAHPVKITKQQHKENTMRAAKLRRMHRKRANIAAKKGDKTLMQVLKDALKDIRSVKE
jgi:hypothetical protein